MPLGPHRGSTILWYAADYHNQLRADLAGINASHSTQVRLLMSSGALDVLRAQMSCVVHTFSTKLEPLYVTCSVHIGVPSIASIYHSECS